MLAGVGNDAVNDQDIDDDTLGYEPVKVLFNLKSPLLVLYVKSLHLISSVGG